MTTQRKTSDTEGARMSKKSTITVRWMIRSDMEDVMAIETAAFDIPWTEEDFMSCLKQRNCIGMVAERDDVIVGFMVYELLKNALHVLNFAVDPKVARTGVGTAMVGKLVSKLSQQRRKEIDLEIRETNLAAQLFFRAMGFKAYQVIDGYYDHVQPSETAYMMRYRLGDEYAHETSGTTNRISGFLDKDKQ